MGRPWARTLLPWIALVAVYGLLRWNLLDVPLGRDEGGYAYTGRVILEGGLPYRDALDHRPPGVFYLNALALALFPPTARGVHTFLHLFNFATLLAVAALAREVVRSHTAAFAAALAFAVISASPAVQGFAAATEMYMMLPQTLCLLLALRALRAEGGRRAAALLASGACGALACWIKQPAATSVAFAGLWAAFGLARRAGRAARPRAALSALGLFALGGLAVSAPIVGYFALQGLFSEFLYWSFQHSLLYSAEVEIAWARIGRGLLDLARGDAVIVAAALASIAYLLSRRRSEGALLLGFLLASLLGTLPGKAYPHYFCQILPPLAVAAGAGAALLLEGIAATGPRRLVAAAGVAAAVGVPLAVQPEYYLTAPPERIARAAFRRNPFVESQAVADFLRRESEPDDAVLILGSEPQIPFLADRPSAIPYLYFYPLLRDFPRHREFQQDAWARIQREPPAWIVTTDVKLSLLWDGRAERTILDRVGGLLEQRYELRAVAIVGRRGGLVELSDGLAPAERAERAARIEQARRRLFLYRLREPGGSDAGSRARRDARASAAAPAARGSGTVAGLSPTVLVRDAVRVPKASTSPGWSAVARAGEP